MTVRTLAAVLAASLPATALAQAPAPFAVPPVADRTDVATAPAIAAQVARTRRELARNGKTFFWQPLVQNGREVAAIEYWSAPARPAIHPAEAEYATVLEGSGTLLTGGTLIGAQQVRPGFVDGDRIEGGTSRVLHKGDVVLIPAGVPHWFGIAKGQMLVLLGTKIPSPPPAAAPPQEKVAPAAFPVRVTVDAAADRGPVVPLWRFFGADEPNYATMKDGRATLASLGALDPGQVYFRAHNLLTSGDGTPALKWGSTNAYTEDARGRPVYDWTAIDRIFDSYRAQGVKPYVEVGFMPEALSRQPHPYQHDFRPGSGTLRTGWAYPPRDMARWRELVQRWVTHLVDRYGADEVRTWYFEAWNEANLPQYYWGGTEAEFLALHDATMAAVRKALPGARVGGPDYAGTGDDSLRRFLDHVRSARTPTDFISFHAKGAPQFIAEADAPNGGHVRMGIATHLGVVDKAFATIAADPQARALPVIIGESDPEGCAACQGPANAYRNGTMYSSYTAAVMPRLLELAQRRGVNLQGALTWAFEFEDQPPFAGFRQLTSAGIDLPVLNVFRLFARMGGRLVAAQSDHQRALDAILAEGVRGGADVGSVATVADGKLAILLWHYHDDDLPGPDAAISVDVTGLPPALAARARLTRYQVDRAHANAYAAWTALGSPLAPSDAQRASLIAAAKLQPLPDSATVVTRAGDRGTITLTLPRQGVTLLLLEP